MAKQWATYGVAGPLTGLALFGKSGLIGAFFGFLFYEICSAKEAGHPNRIERFLGGVRVSIRFSVRGVYFHLHHWLLSLVLLGLLHSHEQALLSLASKRIVHCLYGSCIGGTAQGLRYKDRLKVVWWKRRRRSSNAESNDHVEFLELDTSDACNEDLVHEIEEAIMGINDDIDVNDIDLIEIEEEDVEKHHKRLRPQICSYDFSEHPKWLLELGEF